MKHLADENWWMSQTIVFATMLIVRDVTANNIFKTYCRVSDFVIPGSKPILCAGTNSVITGA